MKVYARLLAPALAAALVVTPASPRIPHGAQANAAPPSGTAATIALLRKRVKHVFVIYQENRSFDSYFGTFPGAEGIYSHPAAQTPGFTQTVVDKDGKPVSGPDGQPLTFQPFRIGPAENAADTDDIDHSHERIVRKMDIANGAAKMDRFASVEYAKYTEEAAKPDPVVARNMAALAMAHEDCDTVPFLWRYAKRFVLFDNYFQEMTAPSTPGNLAIIGAQTGESQWLFHPAEHPATAEGPGVPVLGDADPHWISTDESPRNATPINLDDLNHFGSKIQVNLTYPTVPLTLAGATLPAVAAHDTDRAGDYRDIADDVGFIGKSGRGAVPWGWYEEGFDPAPAGGADPLAADNLHASYITHHNGPQYFGYVANNAAMRAHLHGLRALWSALRARTLPERGVFYVKGGAKNELGLQGVHPVPKVRAQFLGDDDHPVYSDAYLSEAMVAETVNAIASSAYWKDSAIVITWDDSEGDYDHVPPRSRVVVAGDTLSDGPRVPLIVISPFARSGERDGNGIDHDLSDTASVVKFVDVVFGLDPLASLPDQVRARAIGLQRYNVPNMGARDGGGNEIGDLVSAFDDGRLSGTKPPLPAAYAMLDPDPLNAHRIATAIPPYGGAGCKAIGIVPTDANLPNPKPPGFNPLPRTNAAKT